MIVAAAAVFASRGRVPIALLLMLVACVSGRGWLLDRGVATAATAWWWWWWALTCRDETGMVKVWTKSGDCCTGEVAV